MDPAALYQIFGASFSSDANVRMQAELELHKLEENDGFVSSLLQIIGTPASEQAVRQAAAIFFKNRIQKGWEPARDKAIGEADRAIVRQSIVEALLISPETIRKQLIASISIILNSDYPDKWPGFLQSLHSMLQSNDSTHVYGGLLLLRELVKVFHLKKLEKRTPLNEIIQLVFPTIQAIANGVLESETIEAAEILKLVLKIYHTSIQYELSAIQQESSWIVPWGSIFIKIVEKPPPACSLEGSDEDREAHVWWKTKKWAYHCLLKLFSRYGTNLKDPKYGAFAATFLNHFAPNILQTFLAQIHQHVAGQWLSSRVKQQLATFIADCVKHKNTWALIKPHLEMLIQNFIFPALCFSEQDQSVWEENPVEFINKKVDPIESFYSLSAAAEVLLIGIVRDRFSQTFIPVVTLINNILTQYNSTPEGQRNPRRKDGALNMMGVLAFDVLKKQSSIKDQMDQFLITHVFPEFDSPHAFLRLRACDLIHRYIDVDFANPEHKIFSFQKVLNAMQDPELPVRITAALALGPFREYAEIHAAMIPHAPEIMQAFLNLTNEIDMDTLSDVMEDFVADYAEQLTPFAIQLTTQMTATFMRILGEVNFDSDDLENLDEDADKILAASGVLKTLCTLVVAVDASPDILRQLEVLVAPIIIYVLEKNVMDLYEDTFELLDSCTYCLKAISPVMWTVFDYVYRAFKADAVDYIQNMLPSLDNFISFGKEVFVQNKAYQHIIYDIIESVFVSAQAGETDRIYACQLIESLLLNLRGQVDQYIPQFLDLAFRYLKDDTQAIRSHPFRIHCLEVVINCIFYNPTATLALLEQAGLTTTFFTLWFKHLEDFTRVHDKKLCISAICAIMDLPVESLPASVQSGYAQIVAVMVSIFDSLPAALEERQKVIDDSNADWEEDEDDDEGDEDLDEINDDDEAGGDVANISEEEYLEFLSKEQGKISAGDDDEDDFDDWFVEDIMEEDPFHTTPLDDVDAYIRFQETLNSIASRPAAFTLLKQVVNAEQQAKLDNIIVTANDNRVKQAEAAAKKQQQQQA
ncbi:armadillo-type protein [Polychytrium aggregatum]|uniref:armadillo-type protein n=1 Tax=Polychytrium aggregatum TaxID=110093 RepID=UPI0022FE2D21|nr:armadillo-type protein [Polychytrium aggregatum]KAI9202660.1 armadillo-type protein [Polychytrium aggregatum]